VVQTVIISAAGLDRRRAETALRD
jgi:lycopene beta-cyclase